MPYRALTDVLLGHGPPAVAGELIPDTYVDSNGDKRDVDFERLVDLGAAEKVSTREAKKQEKAEADDQPQDSPAGDDPPEDPPGDDPPQE